MTKRVAIPESLLQAARSAGIDPKRFTSADALVAALEAAHIAEKKRTRHLLNLAEAIIHGEDE